ncbi:DEAD/DEAH box helicase [Chitinilyticum litopenaei]|uniref:DEAD/DEAH box helicase n=1 Tax=Chitinilyticum litopenaei TaxID=1121276 RepID=UPI000417BE7D|nr:DEAD/DEAH box helicase [Chitinilyticum litopenaei]
MSFAALGLSDEIVRAVTERGYTTPTPIQTQVIPSVLAGGDILAGAQTGTGKTAGFVLPLLQLLNTRPPRADGKIRALILAPTRELAAQVEESVQAYGAHLKLPSMVMFGGVAINPQIKKLQKRVDILVATPGRLLDHAQQGTLDLSGIEILVLDEADRMLDMGFIHDIKKVLALLPPQRQNLLFSATYSDEIKALADKLLNQPVLIEVARRNAAAETIAQRVHIVDRDKKRELLTKLIQDNNWHQVLVFTRTKHGANRLAEQLNKSGVTAMAIHGNKSQNARTKALSEFKSGELQVLVATDIAARGIDITELPHVINFELPNVPEDYVHRIGRTGRAGAEGEALSLVCVDEFKLLADIEKLLKRELPRFTLEGFEADLSVAPEPLRKPREPREPRAPRAAKPPRAPARAKPSAATATPAAEQPAQDVPKRPPRARKAAPVAALMGGSGVSDNAVPPAGTEASATDLPQAGDAGADGQAPRNGGNKRRRRKPGAREGQAGNGQPRQGQGGGNGQPREQKPRKPQAQPQGQGQGKPKAAQDNPRRRDPDAQPLSNENTPLWAYFGDTPRRNRGGGGGGGNRGGGNRGGGNRGF